MRKILVICGPTATGKTSVALFLAKKFSGEIISADSRQVYKKMDIGTGKDLSPNAKYQTRLPNGQVLNAKLGGFYLINKIPVWGYDLIDFKTKFSVSSYVKIARRIIANIQKRNKLPIIVGGTGLYIKALIDGIDSAEIPRNESLRMSLEEKSPSEVFEILNGIDTLRASLINESDKKNRRRLIRSIEIAEFKKLGKTINIISGLKKTNDIYIIGLIGSLETLNERIKSRISQRISLGFLDEIKNLIKEGFLESPQTINTLGYKQWIENNDNKGTFGEFENAWKTVERRYMKRQLTWFKKDKRIKWFNIENKKYIKEIENKVQKWYYGKNETSCSKS